MSKTMREISVHARRHRRTLPPDHPLVRMRALEPVPALTTLDTVVGGGYDTQAEQAEQVSQGRLGRRSRERRREQYHRELAVSVKERVVFSQGWEAVAQVWRLVRRG